jgi:tetratricopeptide (TPR) repeat protein
VEILLFARLDQTMKSRRLSDSPLPRSPLDFAYRLVVRPAGAEGASVLAEVPEPYTLHALKALRLVLTWSREPDTHGPLLLRAEMDRWEAAVLELPQLEGLWEPLVVIAGQLKRPARARGDTIGKGCLALSEWATGVGAIETTLLFAEAAALAWPENARLAWVAGRLFRSHARYQLAEYWLRRAARVAVWSDDFETQDLALNSLGNLFSQQGSFVDALDYLTRALSVARKHRIKGRQGAVTHDLFAVAVLTGDHSRAERLAVGAFRLYGPTHPNLPKLAHDVVQLWLRQGRFLLALPVLRALLRFFDAPQDRLRVLASTARAAGACGERSIYERTWIDAWSIVRERTPEVEAVMPAVLVDLGLGAASLGDWSHATEAFSLALEAAEGRGAHDEAANAEMGLEMVGRYERVEVSRRPSGGPAAQLADAFVHSLEKVGAGAGQEDPTPPV